MLISPTTISLVVVVGLEQVVLVPLNLAVDLECAIVAQDRVEVDLEKVEVDLVILVDQVCVYVLTS